MACPPTSPDRKANVWPNFSATTFSTFTASGTISRPTPSPASTAIFAFTEHSPSLKILTAPASIPKLPHLQVAKRDRPSKETQWRLDHYSPETACLQEAHRQRRRLPLR